MPAFSALAGYVEPNKKMVLPLWSWQRKEDVCFSLRFDDDVDIDVPCGQHQLMPDPDRCISFEPPQPERECPLPGLPCSTVSLWH